MLFYDVDNQKGHNTALQLMDVAKKLGFKSSFNFVPERYNVSSGVIQKDKERALQVYVHGLKRYERLEILTFRIGL